jgi:nucleoid-associated protein YgaU
MARGFLIITMVGFLLVSGYGCGIKARTYVAERERVDQANTGNSGYVKGEGAGIAGRPTRKVYVVEFEREKKPAKNKAVTPAVKETNITPEQSGSPVMAESPATTVPAVENAEEGNTTASSGATVTEYTVQKDDTLQKIAKKVYNSYGKWTKIYDANKDKIKNPNFVKPGTVLTIPAE